ncbi:MAG: pantetheine-phosphate adenylyltransferase [Bradymonadia bacterium]|jgi:pantetheine-phosphate adenylyltransferase
MKRLAVYAGTFDPPTLGHLDVVQRAARMLDEVHVLVAVNPDKSPMFEVETRVTMWRDMLAELPNAVVSSTSGYVVAYAGEVGAGWLVRGVRGATDAEAEAALALANHKLAPDIETIWIPAREDLAEVSSTELKRRASSGEGIERYASPMVAAALRGEFMHPTGM